MTRHYVMFAAMLAAFGCQAQPHNDARVTAASFFTQRYSHSRLAKWNVRASAAGRDCGVLLVETSIVMEDSMVEAMHYGGGAYGVIEGGVQRFYRERSFRGVAYKDSSSRIWTYGDVTREEAEALKRCG